MREIEREEKLIESDKLKTELSKKKFISEIKSGLGKEIKENAGVIKKKKVGLFKRIFNTIMETF
jgi:hypothetical protein